MRRIIEKPEILAWLRVLSNTNSNAGTAKLYKEIAAMASKPKRKRVEVNLVRLSKAAKKTTNIVVPGKILGTGEIKAKFNVSAIEFSGSAKAKLEEAGCSILTLDEMLSRENVKVVV